MSGSLAHSPARIVRKLMIDQSIAEDLADPRVDWTGYYDTHPDRPHDSICVFGSEGVSHGKLQPTGELQTHEGINIRIRADVGSDAWTRANLIFTTLNPLGPQTVNVGGTLYTVYNFAPTSPIIPLGREPDTNRFLYTLNYLVPIRQN